MAAKVLPDYDATVGEVRELIKAYDGKQANDPRRLAQAIVRLSDTEEPPLRTVAGADAVGWSEEQLDRRRAELERWRALSSSLAFEQTQP
jgi:hypothetical protein